MSLSTDGRTDLFDGARAIQVLRIRGECVIFLKGGVVLALPELPRQKYSGGEQQRESD